MGTAGTIIGTARFLKERNPDIKIIGADPAGSIYSGDEPRAYKVEGIGTDSSPPTGRLGCGRGHPGERPRLIRPDPSPGSRGGHSRGGSAGTALGAALDYARRLGPADVVVVLLPDTGRGYLSKIYNETWLRENGFLEAPSQPTLADVLAFRRQFAPEMPSVIGVTPSNSLAAVVDTFHRYGISQIPVIEHGRVVGSLTESQLLQRLAAGEQLDGRRVGDWQGPPLPALPETAAAREAYTLFAGGQPAVAVMGEQELRGVLSKSDLMEFWAHGAQAPIRGGERVPSSQ